MPMPAVAETVGLVPRASGGLGWTRCRIADFARRLNVDVVGLHLGCIPHDADEPLHGRSRCTARQLCDYCRGNGQGFPFGDRAGNQPACCCNSSMMSSRENLFINFDPANMILYGAGEPIAALEQLGPYVRSVHCKDARWATQPGRQWGVEVPLGEGDV